MPEHRVRQSNAAFERLWIDEAVAVGADLAAVHALLVDIDGWPSWVPGLRSLRRIGGPRRRSRVVGAPLRVGGRFGMFLSMPPLPAFWVPCQLFVSRPDFVEWGGRAPWSAIRHRFELTPLPGGRTHVRHVEYATGWLAAILVPFEGTFRRHDERWTAALAARFADADGGADAEAAPEPPQAAAA